MAFAATTTPTGTSARKRGQDSHGGFFLEDDDVVVGAGGGGEEKRARPRSPVMEPPPMLSAELGGRAAHHACTDCGEEFYDSLLVKQFDLHVCDNCRRKNDEGKYSLVTKTEAKDEYLLTDTDLDSQYGGLRCIEKKNPHNERWGMMKLFLRFQVQDISYTRFGGEEGLEKEIERRFQERLKLQQKRQKNKVLKMRKETLVSMWKKPDEDHVHKFGPDQDLGDGNWKRVCDDCSFEVPFEKM